jgi:hypothetical protein
MRLMHLDQDDRPKASRSAEWPLDRRLFNTLSTLPSAIRHRKDFSGMKFFWPWARAV